MNSFGFHFRYRLSGLPPSIQRFAPGVKLGLVPGDMVSLDGETPALAATSDVSLLGCVIEPRAEDGPNLAVIADEDAVYSVADPHKRTVGTNLDLAGNSGAQAVKTSVNDDFEVVAASTADEETLLRQIADRGPGLDDPLAGYVPPTTGQPGREGLWIARQLVSRLELIPAEPGLTVRLWL